MTTNNLCSAKRAQVCRNQSWKSLFVTLALVFTVQVIAQSAATSIIASVIASNDNSELRFRGEHAGMPFEGVFEKWESTIVFPPSAQSSITASFDLSSAKTGDRTYDSTLPEGDWFDIENTPIGHFVSTSIQPLAEQTGFAVNGNLTLRGISKPVSFNLIADGNKLKADINVQRLDYKIGLDSDPDGDWVSKTIKLSLAISVNP